MRLATLAALALPCGACVWSAPAQRDGSDYRSREAYGPAHWGMTSEELRDAVADLSTCGTDRLCRDETLGGRAAHVSYELYRGHLAQVRVQVDSVAADADFRKLQGELSAVYGTPLPKAALATEWMTPESELWLIAARAPRPWLQLTLSSRVLLAEQTRPRFTSR